MTRGSLAARQWILDFVLCNGIGIEIGMWACHMLEMRVRSGMLRR